MRHNPTDTNQYLPVPTDLRPMAVQIESFRIPLDRARLDAHRAVDNGTARPTDAPMLTDTPAVRTRRLLDEGARAGGEDVFHSGDLAVASRSHALVEISGLRHCFHLFREYLIVPDGHTLREVEVPTVPFLALAHLSGDESLASAVASGDVYSWLGEQLDLDRTATKQSLFGLLTGAPVAQLTRRLAASGRDPETILPKAARISELFPRALDYTAHLAPYEGGLGRAQAMTNRVVNSGLSQAHRDLVAAGLRVTAAVLAETGSVVYLVPDGESERFSRTLEGLTVTREGITLPVSVI